MKILEQIKKGIFQGIGIILVLGISGITYATWINITNVTTGQTLDASLFNNIIDNQKDLDTRLNAINPKSLATAWVRFDINGAIADSYNVSSVTKNAVGDFNINFSNSMTNLNYSPLVTRGTDGARSLVGHIYDTTTITLNGFRLATNAVNLTGGQNYDAGLITVVVYGGK